MSDASRLALVDKCADAAQGANLVDCMGVYAVLLLAMLDKAKRVTAVPEPVCFAELRRTLRHVIREVHWHDIKVEVSSGRAQ